MWLPLSKSKCEEGWTDESANEKGMTLLRRSPFKVRELPEAMSASLIELEQRVQGINFSRLCVLVGDETSTRLLSTGYPKDQDERFAPLFRNVLSTVKIIDRPEENASSGGTNFTLGSSPLLKPVAATITGIQSFTIDGTFPTREPDAPLFIATESIHPVQVVKQGPYAEELLRSEEKYLELKIESTEAFTLDMLSAHETIARAKLSSGEEVVVYQVFVRSIEGGYYRMLGQAPRLQRDRYLRAFKALARTFSW